MPAEWEPHAASWVAWPWNPETWPGCLEQAEAEFETLVGTLARFEPVRIAVRDEPHAEYVHARLGDGLQSGRVRLWVIPTDDAWLRDTGPTFVRDAQVGLIAIEWSFNAWGGKYPPWDRDDAVSGRIARIERTAAQRAELVLEGGALEVDGAGTLLATRQTLLDAKRNPGLDAAGLEERLAELLGIRHIVWLDGAIAGDDTDGHIDGIARFVAPGRVVCARAADSGHPDHAVLERCRSLLEGAVAADGRPLEVVDLPMPGLGTPGGAPLPASYANFYIANGAVLVPTFGCPADESALAILTSLFPDRAVLGVPCRTLVHGLGAVHCLTQQVPAPADDATRD